MDYWHILFASSRWLQNATIVSLNPQGTSNLKLYSYSSLKLRPLTRVNLISVRLGLGWAWGVCSWNSTSVLRCSSTSADFGPAELGRCRRRKPTTNPSGRVWVWAGDFFYKMGGGANLVRAGGSTNKAQLIPKNYTDGERRGCGGIYFLLLRAPHQRNTFPTECFFYTFWVAVPAPSRKRSISCMAPSSQNFESIYLEIGIWDFHPKGIKSCRKMWSFIIWKKVTINVFSLGAIPKTNFQTFKTGSKMQNFSKIVVAYKSRPQNAIFCFGHFFDISHSNGEKCTGRFSEGG